MSMFDVVKEYYQIHIIQDINKKGGYLIIW